MSFKGPEIQLTLHNTYYAKWYQVTPKTSNIKINKHHIWGHSSGSPQNREPAHSAIRLHGEELSAVSQLQTGG